MRGRIALAGIRPRHLREYLDVVEALFMEQSHGHSVGELAEKLEELTVAIEDAFAPAARDRDRWGTTPQAQAGAAAAMSMFGPR